MSLLGLDEIPPFPTNSANDVKGRSRIKTIVRQLEYMKQIFNEEQINKAAFIIESPLSKLSELYHSEVKNLAILMSWTTRKD